MKDMKGDMAGAACVTGLMHALAARKARVNAVGVIGLVENMPGRQGAPAGRYRHLDVRSDHRDHQHRRRRPARAGRLLWYAAKRFKPKFMVDLATLTGAIVRRAGHEYAGVFSNDDKLAERLTKAGRHTGERVWRMPLDPEYDKHDRFQIRRREEYRRRRMAVPSPRAQFIQRFVADKTPWAHLDIAGTGFGSPQNDTNKSWGSGWGVRLLDRLVADYYER